MALRDDPTQAPRDAWPLEKRRQDMRSIVAKAAHEGWLAFVKPAFLASTYGLIPAEAEAECMKYLQEGEGK